MSKHSTVTCNSMQTAKIGQRQHRKLGNMYVRMQRAMRRLVTQEAQTLHEAIRRWGGSGNSGSSDYKGKIRIRLLKLPRQYRKLRSAQLCEDGCLVPHLRGSRQQAGCSCVVGAFWHCLKQSTRGSLHSTTGKTIGRINKLADFLQSRKNADFLPRFFVCFFLSSS